MRIPRTLKIFLTGQGLLLAPYAWALELQDVKPPVTYPVDLFWVYFFFGIFVILLFFFMRNLYKTFLNKSKNITGSLSAWETAYRRLEELQASGAVQKGELKFFYDALCDILRRYCEDQFQIKAVEMTTPEFLENIQRASIFDKDQQALFRQFLDACDMVKFAKYAPQAAEADQSFILVKKIIDLTRPKLKET